MPSELIGELILRPFAELILQLLGYYTSRILIPILTIGKAMVEPGEKGVKVYPKWHGFNKTTNGKIVINCEMGALIGMLFWLVLIVILIIVFKT